MAEVVKTNALVQHEQPSTLKADSNGLGIDWSKPSNPRALIDGVLTPLVPTLVVDEFNHPLGLVYSSQESLKLARERKQGVYCSRSRSQLWIKSPSGVNGQTLIKVVTNCNRDALKFVVAQHGMFCHLDCYDCFARGDVLFDDPVRARPFVIALPKGRQEAMALRLLADVGVHVYNRATPKGVKGRTMVKTHLHPKVEIVTVRPNDVERLLSTGTADLVVTYDNKLTSMTLEAESAGHIKKWFKQDGSGIKRIHVVAAVLPGFHERLASCSLAHRQGQLQADKVIKILTEYPEQTALWLSQDCNAALKRVSRVDVVDGSSEEMVSLGVGDMCIVVRDTGATLREFQLEEYDVLCSSDMCVAFRQSTYFEHPRLFRHLKNSLDKATIYFYSVDGEHGYLSNFYPCAFISIGEDEDADSDQSLFWRTSEHYYQAHSKFTDSQKELREIIRSQPTAKECYKTAYLYRASFRPDVDDGTVKNSAMWRALKLKFAPGSQMAKRLVSTYPNVLVEHALKDRHFGCGADGTGANVLGVMLMRLREHLRLSDDHNSNNSSNNIRSRL